MRQSTQLWLSQFENLKDQAVGGCRWRGVSYHHIKLLTVFIYFMVGVGWSRRRWSSSETWRWSLQNTEAQMTSGNSGSGRSKASRWFYSPHWRARQPQFILGLNEKSRCTHTHTHIQTHSTHSSVSGDGNIGRYIQLWVVWGPWGSLPAWAAPLKRL